MFFYLLHGGRFMKIGGFLWCSKSKEKKNESGVRYRPSVLIMWIHLPRWRKTYRAPRFYLVCSKSNNKKKCKSGLDTDLQKLFNNVWFLAWLTCNFRSHAKLSDSVSFRERKSRVGPDLPKIKVGCKILMLRPARRK